MKRYLPFKCHWSNAIFRLFPQKCRACYTDHFTNTPFCAPCTQSLPRPFNPCRRCGQSMPSAECYCHYCAIALPSKTHTFCAFSYEGALAQELKRMKFGRYPALARPLANLLVQELESFVSLHNGIVTPVPSANSTMRLRGFNVAGQLARFVAKATKSTFVPNLLLKREQSQRQLGSSRTDRLKQIHRTIKLNQRKAAQIQRSTKHSAPLILVDDVLTTGATVKECAWVLNQAGHRKIQVLTLGYTPQRIKTTT